MQLGSFGPQLAMGIALDTTSEFCSKTGLVRVVALGARELAAAPATNNTTTAARMTIFMVGYLGVNFFVRGKLLSNRTEYIFS